MRIDPKRLSEIFRRVVESTQTKGVDEASAAASQPPEAIQSDGVSLSQRAGEIQRAKEALVEVPEVRQEKIAEAKQKITEGTLELDTESIAARILEGGI